MVIYELTYWFAKNIHGDPINGKHSYRGDFKTEELAMSAVEDAFRSFIRDVMPCPPDKGVANLIRKIEIHIETTKECIENCNIKGYVKEVLDQEIDLYGIIIAHLNQGNQCPPVLTDDNIKDKATAFADWLSDNGYWKHCDEEEWYYQLDKGEVKLDEL